MKLGEKEKFVVAVTVILEVPIEAIVPQEAKAEVEAHLGELVTNKYHVLHTTTLVHRAV